MTKAEKLELMLIFIVAIVLSISASLFLPPIFFISRLVMYGAALLLLQSLIRDVFILLRQRKKLIDDVAVNVNVNVNVSASANIKKPVLTQCLCVESVVGITGVAIGLCFFGLSIDRALFINTSVFVTFVVSILMVGFFIKDYVFGWNPWKIYKEPDHMNVIIQWKS